ARQLGAGEKGLGATRGETGPGRRGGGGSRSARAREKGEAPAVTLPRSGLHLRGAGGAGVGPRHEGSAGRGPAPSGPSGAEVAGGAAQNVASSRRSRSGSSSVMRPSKRVSQASFQLRKPATAASRW